MAEVVDISSRAGRQDVAPATLLDAAKAKGIAPVMVVGLRPDGTIYLGASSGDIYYDFWLLSRGVVELGRQIDRMTGR